MIELVAWILVGVGSLIVAVNWSIPLTYAFIRRQRRSTTIIPVVGGLLLMLGMFFTGVELLQRYCWVPLIFDLGCLPIVTLLVWRQAVKKRGSS